MTDKRIIDALQCRLASAQANVARWRTRIAENPTASNHQLGVWRGELRQAECLGEGAIGGEPCEECGGSGQVPWN